MDVYNGEPKARSPAHILLYLWNETMSRDLYEKLMNTN